MAQVPPAALADLVATRHVVVCCGSGGVGKTTTAAALALAGARSGRRAVVVTVDPAKRLASALGLGSLPNEPVRIELPPDADGEVASGSLWALTLDTKRTFDDLVRRHAPDREQAERILANRFYENLSTALSGTQEYMATEKLHELAVDPELEGRAPFDLVVVDTPPTRNALDFITAPRRLMRLLDNRIFRVLMSPARRGFRVVGGATQAVLRSIGRVVGGEVVADTLAFFQAFEGMEDGFRHRATAVLELLHDRSTAWVLVTSPRAEAVDEARYFADRIDALGIAVTAVVANRMQPRFDPVPDLPVGLDPGAPLARLVATASDANARADRDDAAIAPLAARVAPAPTVRVAVQPDDVHDLATLDAVRVALVSAPAVPTPGSSGDPSLR